MIRKEKFVSGEYYHVYSRVIFGMPEFSDKDNAFRLAQIFSLANSTSSSKAFDFLRNCRGSTFKKAIEISKSGEKLSEILCYAIMPNHYHLLVKEIRDHGITDFIRRCNTAIAKYINTKKERKGALFESNFKSKHIDSNEYLLHLSVYIHLNPLDFLSSKDWRENKINDWQKEKNKLLNYRWSSLKNYLNTSSMSDIDEVNKNILSGTEIIMGQFGKKGGDDYEKFMQERAVESLSKINALIIE